MAKGIPFISTKPLDIVAFSMTGFFILIVALYSIIIWTTISGFAPLYPGLNFNLAFNVSGYNMLVTQGIRDQKGYGLMLKDGIRIWKYKRLADGQREEIQLYPN